MKIYEKLITIKHDICDDIVLQRLGNRSALSFQNQRHTEVYGIVKPHCNLPELNQKFSSANSHVSRVFILLQK